MALDDGREIDGGGHTAIHRVLGARPAGRRTDDGIRFAVWAPSAAHVSVVGDWNGWDRATAPMERVDGGAIWAATCANARVGHRYKFAVTDGHGHTVEHADPVAFRCEPAPN